MVIRICKCRDAHRQCPVLRRCLQGKAEHRACGMGSISMSVRTGGDMGAEKQLLAGTASGSRDMGRQ